MIIDEDLYLEHFGKKGMRWGKRSAKGSAPKVGRKERRKAEKQARVAADQKKVTDLVTKSLKDPKVLIKLNGHTVVTGKEFSNYMVNGGLLNVRTTSVFAEIDKKTKKYVLQ